MDDAHAVVRHMVRGVVVTRQPRVLLMRMAFPWHPQPVWIAPGGGLEPGETPEEGLRRELREETGRALPVGAEVWQTHFTIEHDGRTVHARERYFLVRTDAFEPSLEDLEPHERRWLLGFRWWQPEELEASDEALSPPGLGEQLARIAREAV